MHLPRTQPGRNNFLLQ